MSVDETDAIGPVDIVVIGYPADAPMTGEAVPIMLELVDRGIVRILDAQVIMREEDGSYTGIDIAGIDRDRIGDLTVFAGATSGLVGDEDMSAIAEALEPGEACVVLVYENRWAAGFAGAVRRNGGRLVYSDRISSQDLLDALEQIEA